MKQVCADPWDAEFIDDVNSKPDQLYNLIHASLYMGIDPLLNLAVAKLGTLTKCKHFNEFENIYKNISTKN